MTYQDWEATVPETLKGDPVWRVQAYRPALFVGELAWPDVTCLARDRRTLGVSDQLYRAAGAISSDVAEGFSRGSGKDRARFYEYALGSARESRDWYYKGRHILGETTAFHRMALLSQVIRLLLKMVPDQRGTLVREPGVEYMVWSEVCGFDDPDLQPLLSNVPLPPA